MPFDVQTEIQIIHTFYYLTFQVGLSMLDGSDVRPDVRTRQLRVTTQVAVISHVTTTFEFWGGEKSKTRQARLRPTLDPP